MQPPSQARARGSGLLPKFCVGELQLAAGEAAGVTEFQADLGEGQFYAVLKTRVEGYFKEHQARRAPPLCARRSPPVCAQLDPRVHPAMFVKSAVILLGLALSWYAAFFALEGRLLATLLAAVLLGVCKAEVGVSIMHDANHGAYSNSTAFARVMGATLDVAGASRRVHRMPALACRSLTPSIAPPQLHVAPAARGRAPCIHKRGGS